MHCVIFSRNRAIQLYSLLTSIRDHVGFSITKTYVLYKVTEDHFAQGYRILEEEFSNITWMSQQHFRRDLISIIGSFDKDTPVLFFVDDNIVYRPINQVTFPEDACFYSMRLSRQHGYPCPPFVEDDSYLKWKWSYQGEKWNYPFSVDGNLYRAGVVYDLIRALDFEAPNSFESALTFYMKDHPQKYCPYGYAPLSPAVYNNPLNKVQQEGHTFHGSTYTAQALNQCFLEGLRFDQAKLYNQEPSNCHHLVEDVF